MQRNEQKKQQFPPLEKGYLIASKSTRAARPRVSDQRFFPSRSLSPVLLVVPSFFLGLTRGARVRQLGLFTQRDVDIQSDQAVRGNAAYASVAYAKHGRHWRHTRSTICTVISMRRNAEASVVVVVVVVRARNAHTRTRPVERTVFNERAISRAYFANGIVIDGRGA